MENRWDDMGRYLEPEDEYRPSPKLIPDNREGFDESGDYHAVPDVAGRDTYYTRSNMPYFLALEIQQHVIRLASTEEYTVGQTWRNDSAEDYVNEVLSQQVNPPALAFDALVYWRRMYGRGVQGEEA